MVKYFIKDLYYQKYFKQIILFYSSIAIVFAFYLHSTSAEVVFKQFSISMVGFTDLNYKYRIGFINVFKMFVENYLYIILIIFNTFFFSNYFHNTFSIYAQNYIVLPISRGKFLYTIYIVSLQITLVISFSNIIIYFILFGILTGVWFQNITDFVIILILYTSIPFLLSVIVMFWEVALKNIFISFFAPLLIFFLVSTIFAPNSINHDLLDQEKIFSWDYILYNIIQPSINYKNILSNVFHNKINYLNITNIIANILLVPLYGIVTWKIFLKRKY